MSGAIFAFVSLLVMVSLLFSWTSIGSKTIQGIQGRYFLPFMLILLTAARGRWISLTTRIDRGIAAAAVSGQLLTIMYVIKQVTTV